MKTMLKVENVSISYKVGDFKDIGLKEWTMRHLTKQYSVNTFLAVDHISFELDEGDMLGIIGANGAGKSTLLKAITGVMEPREGRIQRNGKISALLELASGFDGDLTVRENAYLRGAMLGYTRAFMDQTYEQILDFSELRNFQDRPFKQLSTGMQSRLAFSIASLVQPEILILDEVLSVGDGAFQEKSAIKMREIISNGAATILVSHSLDQIRELCNKVLWLDHGKQRAFGNTDQVCNAYESFLTGTREEKTDVFNSDCKKAVNLTDRFTKVKETLPQKESVKCGFDYSSLLSDTHFIKSLKTKLSRETTIWGDPSKLNVDSTACMVNTFFNTDNGTIFIGPYTFTGHNVCILTDTHDIEKKELKRMETPHSGCDIHIGRGVWIASNSTILGPCTIGDNAVIREGSVVVPGTTIPANTIWSGVPAKQIQKIE